MAALLITGVLFAGDARLQALEKFLASYPGRQYSSDFLEAADRYKLDWRLLPAICVIESGCGQRAKNNNMFGWMSGRKKFYSSRQGIYHVASRLAGAGHYSGKSTHHKLRIYNPRSHSYPAKVQKLMAELEKLTKCTSVKTKSPS
jgi:hypothetical protein